VTRGMYVSYQPSSFSSVLELIYQISALLKIE
jgi:hypothetical protein